MNRYNRSFMFSRILFYHLHLPTLNPLVCVDRYPWGWLPSSYIATLNNKDQTREMGRLDPEEYGIELDRESFRLGAVQAYNTIFHHYMKKKMFVLKDYTSPSLSIALDYLALIRHKDVCLPPRISHVMIIDDWIEEESTFRNNKMLGLWNPEEMQHYVLSGVIGPEIQSIYDQKPLKHVVKTIFHCDERQDIWIFEQCLFDQDPQWQIQNMNNVILL